MTVRRYLATAYRGRFLYLPVLVLLLAATAFGTYYLSQSQYEATARIWVEKSALEGVLSSDAPPGYVASPAQLQADKLYQLVQTDTFMLAVLQNSNLNGKITNQPDLDRRLIRAVRTNLGVTALGANTVRISYIGDDPEVSRQIVANTIDQFRTWSLRSAIEQRSVERSFYEKQLQIYQTQMDEAARRVDEFQQQHPFPDPASPQYLELTSLQRELETARNLHNVTRAKIEQANAANSLIDASRQAEFQVLDAPMTPTRPASTLTRMAKYLGLGLVASFGLVALAIAFATWQDTTIRTVDDLRRVTGVPVIDVIPRLATARGDYRPRPKPRSLRPLDHDQTTSVAD